jgi:hypothetical protein
MTPRSKIYKKITLDFAGVTMHRNWGAELVRRLKCNQPLRYNASKATKSTLLTRNPALFGLFLLHFLADTTKVGGESSRRPLLWRLLKAI